jgi:hypothetical protein
VQLAHSSIDNASSVKIYMNATMEMKGLVVNKTGIFHSAIRKIIDQVLVQAVFLILKNAEDMSS